MGRKSSTYLTFLFLLVFSLLTMEHLQAQEKKFKLKVVTEEANVRLKPDIGSVIIAQLPQGTTVESTGKEGPWYLIIFKTDEGTKAKGYVHESLVSELEPLPPEKKKEAPPEISKEEELKKEEKEEFPEEEKTVQPPPVSFKTDYPQYGLNFSLGGNFISAGDLNRGSQGLVDYYRDILEVEGNGKVKPFHLSYALGVEFNLQLSPQFYLGIGWGYFTGGKESLVEFPVPGSPDSLITQPKVQSIPVQALITYYPRSEAFYFKTGVEYHLARCSYSYQLQKEDSWRKWEGKATSQGFGVLGGLGLIQEISPWLNFYAEVLGRYARIKGFSGKAHYTDSEGTDITEEGTLYYYKGKMAGETYPLLFILQRKPSPDVKISGPRQACLNLSGVSVKLGIQFKF